MIDRLIDGYFNLTMSISLLSIWEFAQGQGILLLHTLHSALLEDTNEGEEEREEKYRSLMLLPPL